MIWRVIFAMLLVATVTLLGIGSRGRGEVRSVPRAAFTSNAEAAAHQDSSHEGNADRGQELFLLGNLACRACHSLKPGDDRESAPSLFGIGSRATREEIERSILEPSAEFAPGYKNVTIFLLGTEEALSGRLLIDSADYVIVQDYAGDEIRIERSKIKTIEVGISDMPNGLTQYLTPQQFADLVAFLMALTTSQEY